ncbi:MAG: hypothetical protein IJU80_10735 [Lachnospiraceae bacterium]|nr:hypothetical protein [Lachnospiraceae bacterium]
MASEEQQGNPLGAALPLVNLVTLVFVPHRRMLGQENDGGHSFVPNGEAALLLLVGCRDFAGSSVDLRFIGHKGFSFKAIFGARAGEVFHSVEMYFDWILTSLTVADDDGSRVGIPSDQRQSLPAINQGNHVHGFHDRIFLSRFISDCCWPAFIPMAI